MRHHLRISDTILLGGFLLFMSLAALLILELEYTGKATTATRVNISNSSPASCSTTVGPGYNTISLPCISTADAITNTINGSNITAVYQYVPGAADLWRVHNPNLPSYVVNDLVVISRRIGYVVVASGTATFSKTGLNVSPTSVPIVAGWNLAGYPSLITKSAQVSFESINDSFTEARTFNNSGGNFRQYFNPSATGDLNETVPGRGYWINGTQGDSWVVTS